jgi:hypothetical protein
MVAIFQKLWVSIVFHTLRVDMFFRINLCSLGAPQSSHSHSCSYPSCQPGQSNSPSLVCHNPPPCQKGRSNSLALSVLSMSILLSKRPIKFLGLVGLINVHPFVQKADQIPRPCKNPPLCQTVNHVVLILSILDSWKQFQCIKEPVFGYMVNWLSKPSAEPRKKIRFEDHHLWGMSA